MTTEAEPQRAAAPPSETLRDAIRRHLPTALKAVLPAARWFGAKDRGIAGIAIDDLALDARAGFGFALIGVDFDEGRSERYALPVSIAADSAAKARAWLVMDEGGPPGAVGDALADPGFPALLLRLLLGGRVEGERGAFTFAPLPGALPLLEQVSADGARVGGAEQSNSSLVFGEAMVTKLFRRVEPGTNPDAEIGRFLEERTEFRGFPRPLATGSYVPFHEPPVAVALAQAYVPNIGDGWTWTLQRLAELAPEPMSAAEHEAALARLVAAADDLGQQTAKLHAALASHDDDPAFAPEPITAAECDAWSFAVVDRLRTVYDDLRARAFTLTPSVSEAVERLERRLPALEEQARGFRELVGLPKTRVHGDFHLGQTLRTSDEGWALLDFEGEPARPLAERRAKTSPLKDVAGMLRSFAYARGAALQARTDVPADGNAADRLSRWERAARSAFIAAYREQLGTATRSLVPATGAAFASAVGAWELDKALYEIGYELGNRPDWLHLPLGALVEDARSKYSTHHPAG